MTLTTSGRELESLPRGRANPLTDPRDVVDADNVTASSAPLVTKPAGLPGRVWRLDLPITRPLSLNGRQHHMRKAALVRRVRRLTWAVATRAGVPPLQRIAVELHYVPRDRRRRDPLNLVATLKPVEDGLVDAGVVPDDTPEFVEPTMPRLDQPDPAAQVRLYVLVRELPPTGTGAQYAAGVQTTADIVEGTSSI